MTWFLIALINPVAHAAVNHLDKYLISRYFRGESVGALILFSSLFAILALPVIWFFHREVFADVNYSLAVALMANGALLVGAIICYLYALRDNEASYVAPFFQLVPVFAFFAGYFFLNETLTRNQLWAAGLLVGGSLILSVDFSSPGRILNRKLILLMAGSSLLYAANSIIFKSIAVDQGFLDSLFWDMSGKFIFGVLLFSFVASYRQQFLEVLRANRLVPLALNSGNEILALIGETALIYAVLLAPVALVQAAAGLQPAFVFILGIVLTLFFPKLGKETMELKALAQKIIGIAVITLGVFYIS